MKLGKRLEHIEAMVASHYDHIWDCCCDHGLLGSALLSRQATSSIHFVDVVPALMNELENKLIRFFPENANSQWEIHCADVNTLLLQTYKGKHLVIIAGVGGDLMSGFVKSICQNNPAVDIDFLLCPVHHQFTLRQQLIQLHFGLRTESLITENDRFYEIIYVSKENTGSMLSAVGELIWRCDNQEDCKVASDYLTKTLAHYERKQLKHGAQVQHIIDAYKVVILHAPV